MFETFLDVGVALRALSGHYLSGTTKIYTQPQKA
ncbi:MAG: hypothetical protein IIB82_03395 [Bacteroidetes bacterium]|nr:hypothetical protein [Bacteroidota bacterium]